MTTNTPNTPYPSVRRKRASWVLPFLCLTTKRIIHTVALLKCAAFTALSTPAFTGPLIEAITCFHSLGSSPAPMKTLTPASWSVSTVPMIFTAGPPDHIDLVYDRADEETGSGAQGQDGVNNAIARVLIHARHAHIPRRLLQQFLNLGGLQVRVFGQHERDYAGHDRGREGGAAGPVVTLVGADIGLAGLVFNARDISHGVGIAPAQTQHIGTGRGHVNLFAPVGKGQVVVFKAGGRHRDDLVAPCGAKAAHVYPLVAGRDHDHHVFFMGIVDGVLLDLREVFAPPRSG